MNARAVALVEGAAKRPRLGHSGGRRRLGRLGRAFGAKTAPPAFVSHRAMLSLWVSLLVVPLIAVLVAGSVAGPAGAEQAASAARRVAAASLDAGSDHTCEILTSGALRCWGADSAGQLGHDSPTAVGDGTGPSIKAAGDIPLGGGEAIAVAAGEYHTCALLTTPAVRCWGLGSDGQLGHNSKQNVSDGTGPSIQAAGDVVLGLGTHATAITAGDRHTCALLNTGAVRCWGLGIYGQLGHNSVDNVGDGVGLSIQSAGDVPLGGKAIAIAAGGSHTCALMSTGAVRCWGYAAFGQLGQQTTTNIGDGDPGGKSIESAGDVPLGGKAVAITAGQYHTCALLTTGAVRCWGLGSNGRLGYNSTDNVGDGIGFSIEAMGDVPLGGKAVGIAAGALHTCAVLANGGVRCWGQGSDGQLGHDTTTNIGDGIGPSIEEAGDVPVGGKAVAITAGGSHTCALLATGALRCWGLGFYGQLGHNSKTSIGAGGGAATIKSAGDVPVGGRGQVRAAILLTGHATPKRDRHAPYLYEITGRIQGRFVADDTTCTHRVKITVRKGTKVLQTRSAHLDSRCRYHATIRLTAVRLHIHKTTRLATRIHYLGNTNLQPARITRHLTAH
jgi:alpha-tubulin suppressor-like RCC1 family protein